MTVANAFAEVKALLGRGNPSSIRDRGKIVDISDPRTPPPKALSAIVDPISPDKQQLERYFTCLGKVWNIGGLGIAPAYMSRSVQIAHLHSLCRPHPTTMISHLLPRPPPSARRSKSSGPSEYCTTRTTATLLSKKRLVSCTSPTKLLIALPTVLRYRGPSDIAHANMRGNAKSRGQSFRNNHSTNSARRPFQLSA